MELQREGTIHAQSGTQQEENTASHTAGSVGNVSTRPASVRFASHNEQKEFSPDTSIEGVDTITADGGKATISPSDQNELKSLSQSMRHANLQHIRMNHGVFEPVSVPVSRVPSSEGPSRQGSVSRASPALTAMTPPLSAASSREKHQSAPLSAPNEMNTQPSGAGKATTSERNSALTSRDYSPSRPRPVSVVVPGNVTPPTAWSRPTTPGGASKEDPYIRSKRPPQTRNVDTVEPRFKFDGRDSRRSSKVGTSYVSASGSTTDAKPLPERHERSERPQSGFLSGFGKHHNEENNKHTSMADLKRFFRFGHSGSGKRSRSPSTVRPSKPAKPDRSGYKTPPGALVAPSVPFGDEHSLQGKYGKFGKVLGSGAGGSVRILKRSSDGVTFAVKQFRDRHAHESEREYNKKVTAEFCIGSTLHHGNIIETLDIINEKGHWYEVMEYAPFDLFATVMTGKMSREEVACCFLQIVSGVSYLHSMGLAHRDLKLDNVVINEHGIMKLIDFGSAVVFKYPMESDVVLSTGIVGSDPYLAPEVYDNAKYNAAAVDIWSLAIIFACMSLRRFPWKAPRLTDNSYKLFVSQPTPGSQSDLMVRRPSANETPTRSSDHSSSAAPSAPKPKEAEVIKGPWRLLRLLPRESRNIISRMLEVDPKNRATLEDLLADPWVANSPRCQQRDHGEIVKATNHTHTLEAGTSDAPPSKK